MEKAHAFQAAGVVGLGAGVVQGGISFAWEGGRGKEMEEREEGLGVE